ncbi:hypothetical protein ALC60_09783 [Trachymyrmex zeteki]|uniref:Uncharacterized protein n=1 Tax=Mycetomoellerius zeteki TaxID=64791 RepID=A0A151WU29_9HYME|nr:hypothetical protein ALC60_09783 [Trachymyrmex zeteki]
MGLIQVQRQCRRLYDDEEHLGDRRACNFLVVHRRRTCTPLCMRVQHTHKRACIRETTLVNHISKPVRGGWGIEETNKQAEERRETTDGKRSITRFPDPPLGARLCIFAFKKKKKKRGVLRNERKEGK